MKPAKREYLDQGQAEAARIILASPQYGGLMREWAELWAARHPKLMQTPLIEKRPPTLEERITRYEEHQQKKRIASRRERWQRREWRISRKGNFYLSVNHFHIVVFRRQSGWAIRIADHRSEEFRFSPKEYERSEDAKAAAFDLLVYMESYSSPAVPQLVTKVS